MPLDEIDSATLSFCEDVAKQSVTTALKVKVCTTGGFSFLSAATCQAASDRLIAAACRAMMQVVYDGDMQHREATQAHAKAPEAIASCVLALARVQQQSTREALAKCISVCSKVTGHYGMEVMEGKELHSCKLLNTLAKGKPGQCRIDALEGLYNLTFSSSSMTDSAIKARVLQTAVAVLKDGLGVLKSTHGFSAWRIGAKGEREEAISACLNATALLCNLLTVDSARPLFPECGGLLVCSQLLAIHQFLPALLVERLCRLLCNFLSTHEAQTLVTASGAHNHLIQLLSTNHPSVVENATAALCNLTYEHTKNRDLLGQSGAIQACVGWLQRALTDLSKSNHASTTGDAIPLAGGVVMNVCALIGNLCKKNKTNRELVRQQQGLECLLQLLSHQGVSPGLLSQAARALGNVILKCSPNIAECNSLGAVSKIADLIHRALQLSVAGSDQVTQASGATSVASSSDKYSHSHSALSASTEATAGSTSAGSNQWSEVVRTCTFVLSAMCDGPDPASAEACEAVLQQGYRTVLMDVATLAPAKQARRSASALLKIIPARLQPSMQMIMSATEEHPGSSLAHSADSKLDGDLSSKETVDGSARDAKSMTVADPIFRHSRPLSASHPHRSLPMISKDDNTKISPEGLGENEKIRHRRPKSAPEELEQSISGMGLDGSSVGVPAGTSLSEPGVDSNDRDSFGHSWWPYSVTYLDRHTRSVSHPELVYCRTKSGQWLRVPNAAISLEDDGPNYVSESFLRTLKVSSREVHGYRICSIEIRVQDMMFTADFEVQASSSFNMVIGPCIVKSLESQGVEPGSN